jgi:hypothetical protein
MFLLADYLSSELTWVGLLGKFFKAACTVCMIGTASPYHVPLISFYFVGFNIAEPATPRRRRNQGGSQSPTPIQVGV